MLVTTKWAAARLKLVIMTFSILSLCVVSSTASAAVLLGVAPLALPIIDYNVNGTASYDATADIFSIDATPVGINSSVNPAGFFFSGDLDINIEVDDTGSLVGGVPGDDFVLIGDIDIDGDFVVDESGVLLTGEILAFGFEDTGGTTDLYDFQFVITGGLLTTNPLVSAAYLGKDIGVTTTSEASTFTGDFTVGFGGLAIGDIGTMDAFVIPEPSAALLGMLGLSLVAMSRSRGRRARKIEMND